MNSEPGASPALIMGKEQGFQGYHGRVTAHPPPPAGWEGGHFISCCPPPRMATLGGGWPQCRKSSGSLVNSVVLPVLCVSTGENPCGSSLRKHLTNTPGPQGSQGPSASSQRKIRCPREAYVLLETWRTTHRCYRKAGRAEVRAKNQGEFAQRTQGSAHERAGTGARARTGKEQRRSEQHTITRAGQGSHEGHSKGFFKRYMYLSPAQ